MKFTIDTDVGFLHIQAKKDEKFLTAARKAIEALEAEVSDYQDCSYHNKDLDSTASKAYNTR